MGREFVLSPCDEGVANGAVAIDHEERRPRDVPRVETDPLPHTIRLRNAAGLVDQNIDGQTVFFDVSPNRFGTLRQNGDNLDAMRLVLGRVLCQFTEPASAIRSPGSSVEDEQHRASLEETRKRTDLPLLRREFEWRRRRHQNNFTSTSSPASTMSVWAAISM